MSTTPHAQIVPAEKALSPGTVTEGFGALERRPQHETASEVLAAQARAAVQARYIMARQNPRDWDVVRQRLLKHCDRTTFAQVARYSKPVGNTTITGPGVRFVRAALGEMENVSTEHTVIYDDASKRIVRITVIDLEKNIPHTKELLIEKTVERKQLRQGQVPISSRANSRGERVYLVEATEDELLNKEAALAAKALRQLGLNVIPADLVDECMETVEITMRRRAEQDPDAERKAIIDAFYELGVRVGHLKEYLGVDFDQLTPKDLVSLRAVYQALKDGETTWREVMEQRDAVLGRDGQTQAEQGSSKAGAMLDALRAKQAAGGPPQPEQGQDEKAAHGNSDVAVPAEATQGLTKPDSSAQEHHQEHQAAADQPQDGADLFRGAQQQGKSKRGR